MKYDNHGFQITDAGPQPRMLRPNHGFVIASRSHIEPLREAAQEVGDNPNGAIVERSGHIELLGPTLIARRVGRPLGA